VRRRNLLAQEPATASHTTCSGGHTGFTILLGLAVYGFVSFHRGCTGRAFLSLTAACAVFVVAIILPLVAHALSAAVR
jgi:hypothetical protein